MIDGPQVVIDAEWPEVAITGTDDTPEIVISAPPTPQIVLEEVGMRGPRGEDAAGAVDPGDLNLFFDMALI